MKLTLKIDENAKKSDYIQGQVADVMEKLEEKDAVEGEEEEEIAEEDDQ